MLGTESTGVAGCFSALIAYCLKPRSKRTSPARTYGRNFLDEWENIPTAWGIKLYMHLLKAASTRSDQISNCSKVAPIVAKAICGVF